MHLQRLNCAGVLSASGIVFINRIVDRQHEIFKRWTGKRHGLHGTVVERLIGTDQKQSWLNKDGRLFDTRRG